MRAFAVVRWAATIDSHRGNWVLHGVHTLWIL